MGAVSSSAYWQDNEFPHTKQNLTLNLEWVDNTMRIIDQINFKIDDVIPLHIQNELEKKLWILTFFGVIPNHLTWEIL